MAKSRSAKSAAPKKKKSLAGVLTAKKIADRNKGAVVHKKREKGPSARAARIIKNAAPKVVENTKSVLFIRGTKTSEMVGKSLKELFSLRKPFGKMLSRKNDNMHPFEDASSLEFLCQKNDCSLFTVASHSKKRPSNLVVGRMFDGHLLDMCELGIEDATTLAELQEAQPELPEGGGTQTVPSKRLGSKPCVVFLGESWEASPEHRSLRSLLLDVVRGQDVTGVNLASLDHVLAFTANGTDGVHLRTYALDMRKSKEAQAASSSAIGEVSAAPQVKLLLSAPSMDFRIRRSRWASKDLMKKALKQPRELKAKKVKNLGTTALGETVGQLHMERQNYGDLQTRKVKALHSQKAVEVRDVRMPGEEDEDDEEESGGSGDEDEDGESDE